MARIPFSVRFPPQLSDALDRLAARRGCSRSDFIEMMIRAVDDTDRDEILQAVIVGPPTEKRNLRLSAEALGRLKQLAGDLDVSDFLRRLIALVGTIAPPQETPRPGPTGNGHRHSSLGQRPGRPHGKGRETDPGSFGDEVHLAAARGVVMGVLLAAVALVAFIVWLIHRAPDPSPGSAANDRRGQLPGGTVEGPHG